jgi:hypothetical protein
MVHFVGSDMLDLFVLNRDGTASFTFDNDAPLNLGPAWTKRHKIISDCISDLAKKADRYLLIQGDSKEVREAKNIA